MERQLILLGLLCFCGFSSSQDCKPQLQKEWDFPGSDILIIYSPDAEYCQYLCTEHSSCQFFAFIGPECTNDNRHYHCFLKATSSGQPNVQRPKQGTTCGFSLKPCNPDLKPCLTQIYQNVDFNGGDYRGLFTADYNECQKACTDDPGCEFFTWTNDIHGVESSRYRCSLKFSWTVPVIPQIISVAAISSGFAQRIETSLNLKTGHAACLNADCEAKLFPNVNFPGHDALVVLAASPEQCQTLCSAYPLCTYFSYVSNEFKCYLKNNANAMVPIPSSGITSGLPSRFCKTDNNWLNKIYKGMDFSHNDIRNFPMDDAEGCQRACNANPYCQYFSYTPEKLCYVKRVNTLPLPPKVAKVANLVSGFSLKNCNK